MQHSPEKITFDQENLSEGRRRKKSKSYLTRLRQLVERTTTSCNDEENFAVNKRKKKVRDDNEREKRQQQQQQTSRKRTKFVVDDEKNASSVLRPIRMKIQKNRNFFRKIIFFVELYRGKIFLGIFRENV